MPEFNLQSLPEPRVLGSDLDGTLIPLAGSEENRRDLRTLADSLERANRELVFATGRHLESVREAIAGEGLPRPRWMVCDVGATIYRATEGDFRPFLPYEEHLAGLTAGTGREEVEAALSRIDGLVPQGEASQDRFKISYFAPAERVGDLEREVGRVCAEAGLPFACTGSVDPFDGKGLIDLLPAKVSKAYALIWLSTHADFKPEELVYAGDSGNDRAALTAGFRAIAVANTDDDLAAAMTREMEGKGWENRFYRAGRPATSGVLEGCRHFGVV